MYLTVSLILDQYITNSGAPQWHKVTFHSFGCFKMLFLLMQMQARIGEHMFSSE